jgi:hypothetical protein
MKPLRKPNDERRTKVLPASGSGCGTVMTQALAAPCAAPVTVRLTERAPNATCEVVEREPPESMPGWRKFGRTR